MGAWGAKSFENDDAFNWLNEFNDEPGKDIIIEAFEAVNEIGDEYLEAPESSMALAAAEIVAGLKGSPNPNLPDEAQEFIKQPTFKLDENLLTSAVKAVEKIKTDSELKELWEEAEPTEWFAEVDNLLSRLKS